MVGFGGVGVAAGVGEGLAQALSNELNTSIDIVSMTRKMNQIFLMCFTSFQTGVQELFRMARQTYRLNLESVLIQRDSRRRVKLMFADSGHLAYFLEGALWHPALRAFPIIG